MVKWISSCLFCFNDLFHFLVMCIPICLCVGMYMWKQCPQNPERALDPMKLELTGFCSAWMLGTELWSSARAASTVSRWSVSLVLKLISQGSRSQDLNHCLDILKCYRMEFTAPLGYHGIVCKRTFKDIFEVKEDYIQLHHEINGLWRGINSPFSRFE